MQVRPHEGGAEGDDHLPDQLAMLFFMQPRTQMAFWTASIRCFLMLRKYLTQVQDLALRPC